MSKMIERLARKINEQHPNITINPHNVTYAKGYWRTSPCVDVARWEAFCMIDGVVRYVTSDDTITDCLKRGKIEVTEFRGNFEFHAPDRK